MEFFTLCKEYKGLDQGNLKCFYIFRNFKWKQNFNIFKLFMPCK